MAGNGGSAANAVHFTAHMRERGLRAVSLCDNVPLLTAKANDLGYEKCFSEALPRGQPKSTELVVVFSCSGRSPNIVNLLDRAKAHSCITVGFYGSEDSPAAELTDFRLEFPSLNAGAVEDVHSAVVHTISHALQR